MVQISFPIAVQYVATTFGEDATTSGPIKIPSWAPDIGSMATTTIHTQSVGWYASTTIAIPSKFNPGGVYNKRCFNMKTGVPLAAGNIMTIRYNAVGELVRT